MSILDATDPSKHVILLMSACARVVSLKIENILTRRVQKHQRCMKVNPWMRRMDEGPQLVIGILSQPLYFLNRKSKGETIDKSLFTGSKSFSAATHVKWLESSGGKVVPLIYTEPKEVLAKKYQKN